MIPKIINKLFRFEQMNGDDLCPVYLNRWTLLKIGTYSLYLHHFVGDDWTKDFHDHPRRFVSFGLWGKYIEITPTGTKLYKAPWFRSFPPEHKHRIVLTQPGSYCWTIVFVGRKQREWGFWYQNQQWMQWRDYLAFVHSDPERIAEVKSCR